MEHHEKLIVSLLEELKRIDFTALQQGSRATARHLVTLVDDFHTFLEKSGRTDSSTARSKTEKKAAALTWANKLERLENLYQENKQRLNEQDLYFYLGEINVMLHWVNTRTPHRKSFLVRLFD
jgi:hypothetical protein